VSQASWVKATPSAGDVPAREWPWGAGELTAA